MIKENGIESCKSKTCKLKTYICQVPNIDKLRTEANGIYPFLRNINPKRLHHRKLNITQMNNSEIRNDNIREKKVNKV